MKAVYIDQPGGPEALIYGERPAPTPAANEVLVKVAYSGVNFIDTYHRSGLYKLPTPAILGSEAAGTVEGVGEGVKGFKPGDRVAYAMSRGSYAEYHAVPAAMLVKVPESVELDIAAAVMLQGMTAHYLTHSTFPLKRGDKCLVHAAAGGAGRLIVQMAKMLGATEVLRKPFSIIQLFGRVGRLIGPARVAAELPQHSQAARSAPNPLKLKL